MKITTPDIECPKCKRKFTYDSGWHEMQPYQYKKDAEEEIKRLTKENPNMKYDLEGFSGGWIIHIESK